MEMCYEGALSLPCSYAVMNEEEMTYVNGGFTFKASSKRFYKRASLAAKDYAKCSDILRTFALGLIVSGATAGAMGAHIFGAVVGTLAGAAGSAYLWAWSAECAHAATIAYQWDKNSIVRCEEAMTNRGDLYITLTKMK